MLRNDGNRAQPFTRSSISARLTGVSSTRDGWMRISGSVAVLLIPEVIVRIGEGVKGACWKLGFVLAPGILNRNLVLNHRIRAWIKSMIKSKIKRDTRAHLPRLSA